MELEVGIPSMQRPQQIFVPFDSEIRVKAALHQDAGAAHRDRLVDLDANFIQRAHVRVGRTRTTIGAECANYITNVCIVDVAIDDVGNDVLGMLALTDLVCGCANSSDIMRLEQSRTLLSGHSPAGQDLVEDWGNV